MKKTLTIALLFAVCCAANALAANSPAASGPAAKTADANPFSDPEFQDMMETSDGYLNSKNTMNVRSDFSDFRDSPASAPARTLKNPAPAKAPVQAKAAAAPKTIRPEGPALPTSHYKVTFAGEAGPVGSFVWPIGEGPKNYAREYVFLSVQLEDKDYSRILPRLAAETGFRFVGEKIYYSKNSQKTVILGWVPYANLAKISKMKGVEGTAVEKRSSGIPLKTKVRFTLKVPFQNRPSAFVPDFIKQLTDQNGFSAENWFRLPSKTADSKFSVFGVTGTLPVEMIGELSRSPFVVSVESNEPSL